MQIDISFDNWKALTALLRDENDTYDAVITRFVGGHQIADDVGVRGESPHATVAGDSASGAYFKEVFLQNGTEMRATYKGRTYFAKISDSKWIDCDSGATRTSPSQAAYSITGRNVNGWLFWIVKRPNDDEWKSLNALRVMKP